MDNHIFRSALSGFNRQDVMEYIERARKQAEETAARLEAQVEELSRSSEEARRSLEERTTEKEELSRQLEDMTLRYNHAKNNWEAQSDAKDSFRQDVAQRDQTIREMTEENQRLFHRVQELESQLEDFRREKARVTQLELDAHQRSDEVLAQAQAQAQDIVAQAGLQAEAITTQAQTRALLLQRELEERIGETMSQYDQLAQSFTGITDHITSELRKLDVTAAQLPISLNHLKEGLSQLQEKAAEQ